MNRRDSIFATAALLGSTLPLRAFGAGEDIPIGCMLDLSGPAAAGMSQVRFATQLRFDEANAAGGVHGRKLRLIVEDNGSQPQQAVRVVQKMIRQDRVFAMVNNFGSGTNAATMRMIANAGVINFAPWAASATMFKISGNSPLVFTTVPDYDSVVAYGLSRAIKEWQPKKVGLINMEGPFGDLMKAGVDKALKHSKLKLASEATYKPGEIDFSSHVARMKAAGVDLIFAGTITRETIAVMSEVRKLGWTDVKVLTANTGRTSTVSNLGKETVEGLYGIGVWQMLPDPASNPEVKRLVEGFRKLAGNVEADESAGIAYTYADWFVKILQEAGPKLDAKAFMAAAPKVSIESFATFGKLEFKNQHAQPELVTLAQVKNGKWADVTKPFTGMTS